MPGIGCAKGEYRYPRDRDIFQQPQRGTEKNAIKCIELARGKK